MVPTMIFLFLLLPFTLPKPTLDVKQHLYRYGFLKTLSADPEDLLEALKRFQRLNELEMTGEVNTETRTMMQGRRCGKPPNVPQFAQEGRRWGNSHLTYKIYNWSKPFSEEQIRNVFDQSIRHWTSKVDLDIVESDSNSADILIHFSEQDGPSQILGYAYFPENGDIFFDQDERWTLDPENYERTYFGWVAAHELGHAIGLPHSESRSSIMYPYYSTSVSFPGANDVKALKSLYGSRGFNNTVLCSGVAIDAVVDGEDPWFIVGNSYWIFSDGSVSDGPFELDKKIRHLPDKIDAVFVVENTTYFLSDSFLYKVWSNEIVTQKLISIGLDGLPGGIDAAFYDPSSALAYFFKESKYHVLNRYGRVGKRVVVTNRSIENDWEGLPKNIEAATLIGPSRVLFVKSFNCYLFNLKTKSLVSTKQCSDYYRCK